MSSVNVCDGKTGVVVGEPANLWYNGVSWKCDGVRNRWNKAVCALIVAIFGLFTVLWITPAGYAADDDADLGVTATENITDTQNLLGSNVSEITDAINRTKKETGVTIRLVYLDSFNANGKPDKWVSDLLESLHPKPNTVMLAVASSDGNLVVAVSSNSEEWLRSKSTVDALSDAAQKPLMEKDPDWAKSATDMMAQIAVQKKTSTSSKTVWLSVWILIGALVLLVIVLVVFHVLRRKGVISRRRKGRHSGHDVIDERERPVRAWDVDSKGKADNDHAEASTQDSESVQETSSEVSDA